MTKDSRIGIQVFKHILSLVDNTLVVEHLVSDNSLSSVVKACGVKWISVGQVISDGVNSYSVTAIDVDNSQISLLKINHSAIPVLNTVFGIPEIGFISGTHISAKEEQAIKIGAGEAVKLNNVWLIEPIVGDIPAYGSNGTYGFNFTFFTLKHMPNLQMLNDQRHDEGIFPMSQLGHAIINAVDSSSGMERNGKVQFRELSRFGKETESGVESYLLNLDLTGVRYQLNVQVEDWLICQC